jgi:hypothetical protein
MQQVDLTYLINAGSGLRSIQGLESDQSSVRQYILLDATLRSIQTLLYTSVYTPHFRVSLFRSSEKIIANIRELIEKTYPSDGGHSDQLSAFEIQSHQNDYSRFEAVLEAELQSIAAYTINKKGGFETAMLVEHGDAFFPAELAAKVPDALPDINEAMRCIAFEVWTAAGFHLHRANETVLRAYWDSVTDSRDRPTSGNMGVYLAELRRLNLGNESTLNQLKSLKDFHRNPLMHPEQSLESSDDALDLMAAIRCSIGYMLKEIP